MTCLINMHLMSLQKKWFFIATILVALLVFLNILRLKPWNLNCFVGRFLVNETKYFQNRSYGRLPKALFYIPEEDLSDSSGIIRQPLKTKHKEFEQRKHDAKIIVLYTLNYGGKYLNRSWNWTTDGVYYYPDSVFNCPKQCKVTDDRSLAKSGDAIVFSVLDTLYHTRLSEEPYPELSTRSEDQIWVASTMESPLYHEQYIDRLAELNTFFNWTFTYRLDSDVYFPYGFFYPLEKSQSVSEIELQLPTSSMLRTKKLVASLISNCSPRSNRNNLIKEMKKYLTVDLYGGCGMKCPVPNSECRQYIASNYKFFLAFENTFCQDYITEKFFYSFDLGIVPVTYGMGDYAEVAPPNSYINAFDFPNVEALTNYLTFLDGNDIEYLKYFNWKLNYGLHTDSRGFAPPLCNLCVKLWEPRNYTQQISNFKKWWNHKRKSNTSTNTIKLQNSTFSTLLLKHSLKGCVPFPSY